MKVITAIIEKASDGGYAVYCKEISGLVGYGLTENEATEDFMQVLDEQADFYKERHGEFPKWYANGHEIEYRYDMSALFLSFPYINASEFAEYIGINPSLMRKYKSGLVTAGEKQKNLIQTKWNEMIKNMERVKF